MAGMDLIAKIHGRAGVASNDPEHAFTGEDRAWNSSSGAVVDTGVPSNDTEPNSTEDYSNLHGLLPVISQSSAQVSPLPSVPAGHVLNRLGPMFSPTELDNFFQRETGATDHDLGSISGADTGPTVVSASGLEHQQTPTYSRRLVRTCICNQCQQRVRWADRESHYHAHTGLKQFGCTW